MEHSAAARMLSCDKEIVDASENVNISAFKRIRIYDSLYYLGTTGPNVPFTRRNQSIQQIVAGDFRNLGLS